VSGSSLSRRRLLLSAGAVTAVGLTSCDLDPSSSAPAVEPSPDADQVDADQVIVLAARAELSGLIVRLGNSPRTAALVSVHRTQLAALQGDPPPSAATVRPPTPAQIVAREQRAADRFSRWAANSGSGDLARVLASIAAGIRMQPVLRGVA
jgi:hypothetical protein